MHINNEFFTSIQPALIKIRERVGSDFVVFGSAPLYLLGVVDFTGHINDLDLAVKDISVIPKEAKEVFFQDDPNQKLYKINIGNIEVDIGGCWPGQEDYFFGLFDNPIDVEGFKFANLEILEKWKRIMVAKYDREKDQNYLQKITEYRKSTR